MKLNWKVLLAGLLLVVPLIGVLASGFGRDPRGVSNQLEGKLAPDFTLTTMEGSPVTRSNLTGAPVVLNFWSTWCQPCRVEHPHLQQAAQVYGARGVRFFGVLYNDTPEAARPFLARNGSLFPTLLDPSQRVAIDFGVAGVPETFILHPDGRIVRKFIGPVSFADLSAVLEPLL
jgi:cytochrome c biogenesis protein CcmG/thiol:disulfide interchange protein DsbE